MTGGWGEASDGGGGGEMWGDLPQPHLLASPVGHHGLANTGNFLFFLHKKEPSKFHEAFGLKNV